MNKPTPEALQRFFQSDIFQSEVVRNGDYALAIKAFYKQFYSEFDQTKYNSIGIHMDDIRREKLILDDEGDNNDITEYKTIINFHFIQDPASKHAFSLIGTEEEKAFYDLGREELLNFFVLRFRRFSKLFLHNQAT